MVEILLEARSVADENIANECRRRDVRTQFPRIAATRPKCESVVSLRQDYRKLIDLSRKCPGRDHQKRAEVILQHDRDLMCL